MKRRKLLQILGLIPPALLAASCKEKLPSTPTIVTGTIIDESGKPLEGAGLKMSGIKWDFTTPTPTKVVSIESNTDGFYELSMTVPDGTEELSILPYSTITVPLNLGAGNFVAYLLINGIATKITAQYPIPRSDWGKNATLNFQFIRI